MKVLCLLALLTTADGNSKSDFSEIIIEIFGTDNSTSVATSNDQNSIGTNNSIYNITDFDTLRRKFTQKSKSKSKSRLHISFTNYTPNLCNYTKEYLNTILGDWTIIKFYARQFPGNRDLQPIDKCIKIRLAPSKGICKCHGKELPVFNAAVTCDKPKLNVVKDVAVAFVSHFKDAIKFNKQQCHCKRQVVTGRVLSDNYIMIYDNITSVMDSTQVAVLARNISALWELQNLEETAPELVHRKRVVLCEGVVFYATLKSNGLLSKGNFRGRTPLKLGFGLSVLSFFDYLNVIPREEFLEIAFSSSLPT